MAFPASPARTAGFTALSVAATYATVASHRLRVLSGQRFVARSPLSGWRRRWAATR